MTTPKEKYGTCKCGIIGWRKLWEDLIHDKKHWLCDECYEAAEKGELFNWQRGEDGAYEG